MDYRKGLGASGVIAGLVVAVINFIQGDVAFATILLVFLAALVGVLVWWARPRRGGANLTHAAAQAAAGDGDVIVYWRHGCIRCDRLKLGLGRARHDVFWVDIVKDPEAASFVTTYHKGSETVPTAVTGTGQMIDATPAAIKTQLGLLSWRSTGQRVDGSTVQPSGAAAANSSESTAGRTLAAAVTAESRWRRPPRPG